MRPGKRRVRQTLKTSQPGEKVKRQVLDPVTAAFLLGSGVMMHACSKAQGLHIRNAITSFRVYLLLHHVPTIDVPQQTVSLAAAAAAA